MNKVDVQKKYGLSDKQISTLHNEMKAFNKILELQNDETGEYFNKFDFKINDVEEYIKLVKLGVASTKIKNCRLIVLSKNKEVKKFNISRSISQSSSIKDSEYFDIDLFEEKLEREVKKANEREAIRSMLYDKTVVSEVGKTFNIPQCNVGFVRIKGVDILRNSKLSIINSLVDKFRRQKMDKVISKCDEFDEYIKNIRKTHGNLRRYLASKIKAVDGSREDLIQFIVSKVENDDALVDHWRRNNAKKVLIENVEVKDLCIPTSIKEYLNTKGIANAFDIMMCQRKYIEENEATYDYDFSKFSNLSEADRQYIGIILEWSGALKQINEIRRNMLPQVYLKMDEISMQKNNKLGNFNKTKTFFNILKSEDSEKKQIAKEIISQTSIDEFFAEVNSRDHIVAVLKRGDIHTLEDLISAEEIQLKSIKGMGTKKFGKMMNILEQNGMSIGISSEEEKDKMYLRAYNSEFIKRKIERKKEEVKYSNIVDPIADRVKSVLDETSINEFKFSQITKNAIMSTPIRSVSDLLNMSEDDLKKYRGIGKVIIDEITQTLNKYGMKLGVTSPKEKNEMFRSIYTSDFIQRRMQEIEFEQLAKIVREEECKKAEQIQIARQDEVLQAYQHSIDFYYDYENIFDLNETNKAYKNDESNKHSIEEVEECIEGVSISEYNDTISKLIEGKSKEESEINSDARE